ncbi:hypothetical protein FB556_0224 [Enteractinococcus coprophilus]|uniref:Uncharacterized protein n=1 Tax=Enteractinococcus coprophilus TaxID=1027633 RepID=A0A543AMF6_9MICC|nr:hypothetical protein FB556_0224 [Enteractinococcus coprophilus]
MSQQLLHLVKKWVRWIHIRNSSADLSSRSANLCDLWITKGLNDHLWKTRANDNAQQPSWLLGVVGMK